MFIEVTAKAVKQAWTININHIQFFYPYEQGTRIYFTYDDLPLDVTEDYETIKELIDRRLKGYD